MIKKTVAAALCALPLTAAAFETPNEACGHAADLASMAWLNHMDGLDYFTQHYAVDQYCELSNCDPLHELVDGFFMLPRINFDGPNTNLAIALQFYRGCMGVL